MNKLKIELRSDLCPGSGFSHGGVIDSDVMYDEAGFPYIPARRIKGCLREAAEIFCGTEEINRIFGERGANGPGALWIGNAVLERSGELREELRALARDPQCNAFIGPDEILGLYTSVRSQTEIGKDGTAEENNLRFMRVINQYDPFEEKKQLCFSAELCYHAAPEEDVDEKWKLLKKIAKATRNIGMNRNRGLGSVSCRIEDDGASGKRNKEKQNKNSEGFQFFLEEPLPGGQIKLSYQLENTASLLLSDEDKKNTSSCISGKSVLGALAGAYLRGKSEKKKENPAESGEFIDLFLNGTVKYANANPAFGEEETCPAPLYLNRLKKTKQLVNLMDGDDGKKAIEEELKNYKKTGVYDGKYAEIQKYDAANGNQPKKLKTQFVSFIEKNGAVAYSLVEPERELTFHHRHKHGEQEPEELLYSVETLKSGQRFVGSIYVEPVDCFGQDNKSQEELVNCLKELLKGSSLSFGKSRSAQYGACRLVPFKKREEKTIEREGFQKGDMVVVTLKSDTIFTNDTGSYTVSFDETKKLLARELGLSYKENDKDEKSMIQATEATGYSGIWNMRRPAVPALKAGSAFVYILEKDLGSWPDFVGERCQEGFGQIDILPLKAMVYKAEDSKAPSDPEQDGNAVSLSESMEDALCRILKPRVLETLLFNAPSLQGLGASNIGRITLMLKESLGQARNSSLPEKDKIDKTAANFAERVQSIKTEKVKSEAMKWLDKTLNSKDYSVNTKKLQTMLEETKELTIILKKLNEEKRKKLLKEVWGDYMIQSLVMMKYEKKGEV